LYSSLKIKSWHSSAEI